MSRKLGYRCPNCQRLLAKAEGMQVATQVIKRKCKGCGATWQIVVVPAYRNLHGGGAWFDHGTFTELRG